MERLPIVWNLLLEPRQVEAVTNVFFIYLQILHSPGTIRLKANLQHWFLFFFFSAKKKTWTVEALSVHMIAHFNSLPTAPTEAAFTVSACRLNLLSSSDFVTIFFSLVASLKNLGRGEFQQQLTAL